MVLRIKETSRKTVIVSETVFYAERGKVILEQGRDRGLQEKRRGQSPLQV